MRHALVAAVHRLSVADPTGGAFILGIGGVLRRLRCAVAPHRLYKTRSLIAQDALHAADRVALAVKQMVDAAQEIHIIRSVVAAPAATFHWPDLGESAFPEPQHVLRDIEIACHLADGAESVRRLFQEPPPLLRVLRSAAARVGIDALLEDRRRLEHHHAPWRYRYFGARLGIPPDALALLAHNERAE